MNVVGTYRIMSNGIVIEEKNLITDSGTFGLLRAISGQRLGWASSMVAGIGNVAADVSDKQLQFPVTGGDITATILDPVNSKIYFKSSLPVQDQCTIYEFGCYSNSILSTQTSETDGGMLLVTFTTDITWVDVDGTSAADTTNNRIGKNSISYSIPSSTSVKGYMSFINDLNSIPVNTNFKLAYYTNNVADFILRFKVDDSNYFEADSWAVSNGYHIDVVEKSSFVATGSPSWSNITFLEIEVEATGSTGTVSIDALRYDLPSGVEGPLLSRVVLVSPTEKLPGVPLDIEYVLEV